MSRARVGAVTGIASRRRRSSCIAGTLSMYLGEPPERHDVPVGGVVHVQPGTALQTVNHGSVDLLVYAYGYPPEDQHAEILDSVR